MAWECSGEIRLGDTVIRVWPGDSILPRVELIINGHEIDFESLTFQVKAREFPTLSVNYYPTVPPECVTEGTIEPDAGS